jgi:uncharacterized protein
VTQTRIPKFHLYSDGLALYTTRIYRDFSPTARLLSFRVAVAETDLYIKAHTNLEEEAKTLVVTYRTHIEDYIRSHPHFLHSLKPVPEDESAPEIVKDMIKASREAGVGPMAAVAGAIAERIGRRLLHHSPEILVENGGDIFMSTQEPTIVRIFAGPSPLSNTMALKILPSQMPLGVCTSSRTVGPSLSFGKADAVTVVSPSTALADAVATAAGNVVKVKEDIQFALTLGSRFLGVTGLLIIIDDKMGIWGDLEIVRL